MPSKIQPNRRNNSQVLNRLAGKRAMLFAAAVASVAAYAPRYSRGQSAIWSFVGSDSWNNGADWIGGVPAQGSGNTADFSTLKITSDAAVTLDTDQTISTLIFGDSVLATNSWTLNPGTPGGALNLIGPATLTVNNESATINALINTSSGFNKTGGGTLILNGNNTGTTGTATLTAGNTGLGNDNALGSATLALAGGNIFALSGARVIANPIEMLGNTTVVSGQDVTLSGTIDVNGGDRSLNTGSSFQLPSQNVTVNGSINLSSDGAAHTLSLGGTAGNTTINGIISNGAASSGSLTINNSIGTVTLNGANTYSGTTTFSTGPFGNGTLAIGNNSALGTSTLSWNNGIITTTGGDRNISNPILINAGQNSAFYGSNNLTLSGPVINFGGARRMTNNIVSGKTLTLTNTLSLSTDTTAQQLRIDGTGTTILAGAVSGPGASSLQISTSGAVILRGSNTYGFLSLQGGTVTLDMPNGGLYSGSLSMGGFSAGTSTFVKPMFVVKGPAGGATVTLNGNIGVAAGDSAIAFDTSVGAATLNASGFNFARGGGSGVLDVATAANGSLDVGSTAIQNGVFPYVTTNGGADLATVTGTLLTAYSGYNTYSTGALQNNAATNSLINQAGATSISMSTGTTALNTIVSKGAGSVMLALGSGTALNLGTIGTVLNAPGAGTLIIGTAANLGTLTAGGPTANTNGELILVNNSTNDLIVNSALAQHGTGSLIVTKSGSGRAIFNGSGTYSGGVFVNGGTLMMGTATALGTSTTPTVNAGGTLDLNGQTLTTNSINGNYGVITNSSATASTLTIGNGNTNAAINDVFAGNVRLVKTGTGSIQLGNLAGSSNVGGASLNGGTLRVGGGGYLGSGTISFNGGTLMIAGNSPNPGYGVMNNALVAVSGATGTWRNEQTPFTENGTLSGSGTLIISLHPTANPPTFWNTDGSAFAGTLRFDTALINAGATGNVTGFNLTNANVGSASAKWLFSTDSQGFIAGWGGVGNATIQIGELSSNLGAGTAILRNNSANTLVNYQIGGLNTNATFAGSFVDGGDNNSGLTAITKVGSGTFTLTGAGNSFRGGATVNAGTLTANTAWTGTAPITINGGTLLANASLGAGPATINGGNLVINNVAAMPHPSMTINSGGAVHLAGNTTLGTATGTGLSIGGGGLLDMVDQSINTLTVNSAAGVGVNLGGASTAAKMTFEITGGGTVGSAAPSDQIALANSSATVQSNAGGTTVNIAPFGAWAGGGEYTLMTSLGGGIDKTKFTVGTLPVAIYNTLPDFTSSSTANALVLHVDMAAIPGTVYWRGDRSSIWNDSNGVASGTGTIAPGSGSIDTNWSDPSGANDTHQFPGGNSEVVFSSSATTGNRTTTLGADIGILGLELADSNTVSIGGTNVLSIGANGVTVDAGAAADTISTSGLALNGNQTWTNNSSNTLTVSAPISGPYSLTMNRSAGGTGTFLLSGNNSYAGGTTINTGAAVKLGSVTALGSGVLTMNGGTLDLNNLNLTVGALAGNSGTILNGTAGNATLSFNVVAAGTGASSAATIADGTGVVAVVKSGAGSVLLSGVNSYSGGTTLGGGTLGINADAALGNSTATTGTLNFTANSTLKPAGSFGMARPINVNTGVTGTLDVAGNTLDLNGPISGAGTISAGVAGSGGMVTVSNTTSAFTGTLSVGSASTVKLAASGVLGTATILVTNGGTLDFNGKTFSGVLQIPSGGTFGGGATATPAVPVWPTLTNSDTGHDAILNGVAATGGLNQTQNSFFNVTGDGNIQLNTFWQANSSNTGAGGLIKYGNGVLTIGGGTLTPVNSNNQTVLQVGSFNAIGTNRFNDHFEGGGTVILAKASTAMAGALRFTLVNDGTLVYSSTGTITGGTYGTNAGQNNAVTLNGLGVIDLNGAGSINASVGILSVGTFANLPGTGTFAGFQDFGNGTILNNALTTATLSFGANNSNANAGTAGIVQSVFTGNLRDGLGTLALVKVSGGTAAFATNNSENGGVFTNGTSSITVSGNPGNTFSGGLYVLGGSMYAASDDAFGTGTIGVNGGTFAGFSTVAHTFANALGVYGGTSQLGDTTRTGVLTFNGNAFVNATGTVNVNSLVTLNGSLNGPSTATLTKGGTSTLTLAGSSSFAGNMNINAGTVALNNASALNSIGVVNLGGTGALNVSSVAPYSTPSTLTLAGAGGSVVGAYNHGAGTIAPGTGVGNFTAGTVSFNGGLALNVGGSTFIDLNGAATTGSDQIIVGAGGSLNMSGGRVEVNFLTAPSGTLPRTYTIASYATKSGALANLTFDSRANIGTVDTGSAIQVTVNSYTAGQLTWSGGTSSTWDLSTTPNWTNSSGSADKFFQLDGLTFANSATAPTSVTLNTLVAPSSFAVNATTTNYTITGSGTIAGAVGIAKSGASIFTVNTNVTYTGATSITGGRLVFDGSKAWGPAISATAGQGSDINGGRLVLDYTGGTTPSATILPLLVTGNGQATKFSTGALRIGAAASAANSKGIAWQDDTVNSQFSMVMTYFGDANMDGTVNALDFNAVATNFGAASGALWAQGDFNYDRQVNTLDFTALGLNFGATLAAVPPAGQVASAALGSLVPEPASLSIIGIGAASLLSRRTRRKGVYHGKAL